MTGKLWLEDIHVGHRFRTDVYNLTADDIIEFATKWDPQPFQSSTYAPQSRIPNEDSSPSPSTP